MQVLPSVDTGGRNAVVRQVRWCAAVQSFRHRWTVSAHCQLEKHPVRDVEPVKFVMQYLTQAAVKIPSAGDDKRSSVQHTLKLVRYCPWCTSKNCVAVINPWMYNGVDEYSQRVGVQRPPETSELTKSVVAARACRCEISGDPDSDQAGIVPKWLNVESRKQCFTIPPGTLSILMPKISVKFRWVRPNGAPNRGRVC